ncbi:MAG: HAD family hydrolase [Acidimicrobiales bacterium]
MTESCLVLDFDGTILDTEESLYRSWAELWADHGHELALADWQRNIGTEDVFDPWAELERRLARRLDPGLQDRRRARRDEIQSRHGPRPGILEWLSEARRLNVPVGIASSSPRQWVDGHLQALGLQDRFACVVCSGGTVPAKPSPVSYLLACEQLESDPSISVAVEDSLHGVTAAIGAGMFTVAMPHGLTDNLDLSDANIIVASLCDLSLSEAQTMALGRRPC